MGIWGLVSSALWPPGQLHNLFPVWHIPVSCMTYSILNHQGYFPDCFPGTRVLIFKEQVVSVSWKINRTVRWWVHFYRMSLKEFVPPLMRKPAVNPAKTSDHLVVMSDQDVGFSMSLKKEKLTLAGLKSELSCFLALWIWASHPTSLTQFPHLDIRIITVLPHGV